jgi:hypothetical protein
MWKKHLEKRPIRTIRTGADDNDLSVSLFPFPPPLFSGLKTTMLTKHYHLKVTGSSPEAPWSTEEMVVI